MCEVVMVCVTKWFVVYNAVEPWDGLTKTAVALRWDAETHIVALPW